MRHSLCLLLVLLATSAAGCGDTPPEPPREPVVLTPSAPQDGSTTREAAVQVGGSVMPASARVLLRGERVPVSDGRFSAPAALREGTNVIDVGAPGWRATWRALRVTRRSRIREAGCRPASTLLGVLRLALPPLLVEIEASAAK